MTRTHEHAIELILDDNGIDIDTVSRAALYAIGDLLNATPPSAHDALLTLMPAGYINPDEYGQALLDEFTSRYVGSYDAETEALEAYITKRWVEPSRHTEAASLVEDLTQWVHFDRLMRAVFDSGDAPYLILKGRRVHVFTTGKGTNPLGLALERTQLAMHTDLIAA